MDLNQKIRLASLSILITLLLFCSGCGSSIPTVVNVNVEHNEELNNTVLGKDAFVSIGNGLCYDSITKIVYIEFDQYGYKIENVFVPYYAPNGLPYRYNPETNTFEEIGEEE